MGSVPRRVWPALGMGVGVVALLVVLALHHAAPSVPGYKNDSMTMSPSHVHAGRSVTVRYDHPVNAGLTDTLLFTRWDGGRWRGTNVLASGEWSEPVGDGRFTVITSLAGREVTSWTLEVPSDVPAGTYLVCDTQDDCGLLTVD